MSTFVYAFDEKVRPLMDKIDEVRKLLATNKYGVTFPSVVVVGDQSSGKSSLLESLSSVELPKGAGIVTRCPLVLRLRKSNKRQVYRRLNGNERVLLDETKLNIAKYIEDETKRLAGDEKNIVGVAHEIELQVENPDVRDLTVIDLPGILHNPIADQPEDIHEQTTTLIRHYIRDPSSIILCVYPANVDIGVSESFKLAREVDPSAIRTIGVITKSDLCPDPESLVQQLAMDTSDVLHLKLGFVAVRNRGTNDNISLEDAREREKQFFSEHPASTAVGVGWNCLGIDALINRLAVLYSDRVKETFPKLKKSIQDGLKETHEQLSKLPQHLETPFSRLTKYYELTENYVEKILQVRVNGSHDGRHVSMINMLHEQFAAFEENMRKQNRELWSSQYRSKVKKEMSACFGEQLPNFPPQSILTRLIYEKLDDLWKCIYTLINHCFHKTSETLLNDQDEILKNNILLLRFMPLFRSVVTEYIVENKQAVHDLLNELLKIEKQEPYTINNYYMNVINKFKKHIEQQKTVNPTIKAPSVMLDEDDELEIFNAISNDDQSVQQMIISVYSYWKMLIKRFIDYAALSLRAKCAFNVCPVIRERLRLLPDKKWDVVNKFFAHNAFYEKKRKELQEKKETLEKAYAICHDDDTSTDMMSITSDSSMTFDLTAENVSSITLNGEWAMDVPEKFDFNTPSSK